jgi:alkylated DNA repair dioxygenase AlkB
MAYMLRREDVDSILTSLHARILRLEAPGKGRFDALLDEENSEYSENSEDSKHKSRKEVARTSPGSTLTPKMPNVNVLHVPRSNWTRLDTLPPQNEYYDRKAQQTIFEDWSLSLIIRHINLKRAGTTHVLMEQGKTAAAPSGLHVFENKGIQFSRPFFQQLEHLFQNTPDDVMRDRGDDGRASNLIFHSSRQTEAPCNYAVNMPILKKHAPEVGRVMELYAQGVRHALNATQNQLDECSMSIIRYDKKCGIRQHIDNIAGSLNFEVGPLVSIAVGEGEKYLDMLPTISNNRRLQPVRITVDQGDVIVMDGPARLEWSHSVPHGHDKVMYSLLLKFRTLNQIPAYKNWYLDEMMYYSIEP